jgi:hypothetical protein
MIIIGIYKYNKNESRDSDGKIKFFIILQISSTV